MPCCAPCGYARCALSTLERRHHIVDKLARGVCIRFERTTTVQITRCKHHSKADATSQRLFTHRNRVHLPSIIAKHLVACRLLKPLRRRHLLNVSTRPQLLRAIRFGQRKRLPGCVARHVRVNSSQSPSCRLSCVTGVSQMEKLGDIVPTGIRRIIGIAAFLASFLIASLIALVPTAVLASDWSDTYIGYRYGHDFREPFNPNDIAKEIGSLTHASGYKYGSNFFNIDLLKSNNQDLASGGGGGAQEVYVVYRTTLSGSAVFGTPLKFGGIIRDIGLTAGFDYNAKDDQFSARVYKFAIGPKFSFDVPGF